MIPHRTFFSWSSGKDSALALYRLLQDDRYNVEALLTTVSSQHDRVSIHGLRRELLLAQTTAIGLPCRTVALPAAATNAAYEAAMATAVAALRAGGLTHAAFGDIFLEDLRAYREQQLARAGMQAVFPLWRQDTADLLRSFLDAGFRAVVVCVDAARLDRSFAGRMLDDTFIRDLPAGIDLCGENGEYHTFCFDGPLFRKPVPFIRGDVVFRAHDPLGAPDAGSWYCDLLPVT